MNLDSILITVNFEGILSIVSWYLKLKFKAQSVGIESIVQMHKMKFSTFPLRFLPWQQILATGSIFAYFLLETAVSSATTAAKILGGEQVALDRSSSTQLIRLTPQKIAGADNFNPELKIQPQREYIPLPSPPPPDPEQAAPSPGS